MPTQYYKMRPSELDDLLECARTIEAVANAEDLARESRLGLKAVNNALKRHVKTHGNTDIKQVDFFVLTEKEVNYLADCAHSVESLAPDNLLASEARRGIKAVENTMKRKV
ncbi:hypothetical protein [Neptuniibacter sp. QD37_11]|uniref:hypothetical protein n=1 Tax=Neptuniibacter sp. QD37_11 TaxID=3398209 RepID=UPI0039F4E48D